MPVERCHHDVISMKFNIFTKSVSKFARKVYQIFPLNKYKYNCIIMLLYNSSKNHL